jgi:hypothetical protein
VSGQLDASSALRSGKGPRLPTGLEAEWAPQRVERTGDVRGQHSSECKDWGFVRFKVVAGSGANNFL